MPIVYIHTAVISAIIAYCWCEVLIKPGHIFAALWEEVQDLLTDKVVKIVPDNAPPEVKEMPGYVPKPTVTVVTARRSQWLKPLGECPWCTAGQICLWAILFRELFSQLMPTIIYQVGRTVWYATGAIASAILLVSVLNAVYHACLKLTK